MPYEKVIDGKRYSTATATEICSVNSFGVPKGDFTWEATDLYRSPKGQFFLAGEGGARTRWAQPLGPDGFIGGSGILLVTEEDARRLVEQHASVEKYVEVFGEPEEG